MKVHDESWNDDLLCSKRKKNTRHVHRKPGDKEHHAARNNKQFLPRPVFIVYRHKKITLRFLMQSLMQQFRCFFVLWFSLFVLLLLDPHRHRIFEQHKSNHILFQLMITIEVYLLHSEFIFPKKIWHQINAFISILRIKFNIIINNFVLAVQQNWSNTRVLWLLRATHWVNVRICCTVLCRNLLFCRNNVLVYVLHNTMRIAPCTMLDV